MIAAGIRFGLLGPLCVLAGGVETTLPSSRERTVLAVLLLQPNEVVTIDRLVDAVWGDDPPATARSQVHTCVSRLRRVLRAAGVPDDVLATEPIGYRIKVGDDDLDSLVFTRLVAHGRSAAADGKLDEARSRLRTALGLWRGPALAGIAGQVVGVAAVAMEEQRSAVVEECVELELRLGLSAELVGELTDLVERHPQRERLRAHLMLALYRAGRQADALEVYRRGRQLLVAELGIEPGSLLQDLHRRILAVDPSLLDRTVQEEMIGAAIPHTLPRDVPHFTGRDESVARMLAAVPDDPRTTSPVPVVLAIDGMAGVGKTTLAVHVATRVADRYADGQLFVDLDGHSERQPADPTAVLASLLRQLGVAGQRIPETLDERIALWRTELAGRCLLIVLDNAADTAQVTPLLPGAARCLVLVTSRRRLAGLAGTSPISLTEFSADEAVELMTRVVGDRVHTEPVAAAEVARLCGHLPLALQIATARLNHRPKWTVGDLAVRLRDARPLLRELAMEGQTLAVAFSLSYAHLTETEQRMFRVLGLHPGADLDANAAAALADVPVEEARETVEALVDVNLLEAPASGRYRLHDLLREYARDLVEEAEHDDAVTRLLDHYLHQGAAAAEFSESAQMLEFLRLGQKPRSTTTLSGPNEAEAWFDAEWQNVVAAARLASELKRLDFTWQIPRVVWRFLWRRGYNTESIEIHERALLAARRQGDRLAEANTLNYLASGYYRMGRMEETLTRLRLALSIRRSIGDTRGEFATLANVAVVHRNLGNFADAVRYGEAGMDSAWKLGLSPYFGLPISMLCDLCVTYMRVGRYSEALALARQALVGARRRGDRYDEATAVGEAGAVHRSMGHYRLAVILLNRALRIKHEIGNLHGEADTLSELGSAYRGLGRIEEALTCQRKALRLVRQAGDPPVETMVLNHLGLTVCAAGDVEEALELHRTALRLAERTPNPYEQARAHAGIAGALRGTDPTKAREHWQRALALFTDMGVPERHEVEDRLREMDP